MAGLTMRNVFGDGPSPGCAGPAGWRPTRRSSSRRTSSRYAWSRNGSPAGWASGRGCMTSWPRCPPGTTARDGCAGAARGGPAPRVGGATGPGRGAQRARPAARRPRSRRYAAGAAGRCSPIWPTCSAPLLGSSCPATAERARPQAEPKSAANLPDIHGPSAPDLAERDLPVTLPPGSADELVGGILIGGGVPEFHHLAVVQMKDVRFVDLHAPAARLAVATASATPCSSSAKTVCRSRWNDPSVTSMSLPKNP